MRAVAVAELVAASTRERTATVRALPWGVVGRTSLGPTRFRAGSVAVPAELSWVKLLAGHRFPGQPDPDVSGYLVAAADTGTALELVFAFPAGPAGDAALADAAARRRDAVSVEVSGLIAQRDRDGVLDVSGAHLDAVAQVAVPAFGPARFLTLNP